MKKFGFVMPDVESTPLPTPLSTPNDTYVVTGSSNTQLLNPGPGITEFELPDGTVVNMDPAGNILGDIVE